MVEQTDPLMKTVREFVRKVSDSGIRVEAAYLFGSHARKKAHKWSDIDVAIISPDFSADRLEERIRLTRLSTDVDSRIEPVPFRPDNFTDEDPLAWTIRREGQRI
ncbi:MAG: Nucleotidyltransferase domain protein [Syntrophaceae bacterium PtaB.Bin038]|jgi:predicted nucleotidyltransferase|nr:MAG: Nucleotidyltransferase domain protein [Syntrophaceae bacterium PtaB.Bin038]